MSTTTRADAPLPTPPGDAPSDHGPTRTWWRVLGSIAAVLLLAFCTLQLVSLFGRSTETVRRTVPVDGVRAFDVAADSGDVTIVGTDRDDIAIVARVSHGLWRTRVRIIERDGVVSTSTECPALSNHCSVRYTIEVPREMVVNVDADNGSVRARGLTRKAVLTSGNGDVLAESLAGTARLGSDNGSVEARGMTTTAIEASSGNGDVVVELREPPEQVVAESDNGSVEVVLPDTPHAYDLDLSTDNGERFGQIRTDPASDRHLVIRSDNGDVTVGYRNG